MTISRLKRIEVITTIVVTILLLPYALAVGWLVEGTLGFVGLGEGIGVYFLRLIRLMYGLLAITFAPILLLSARKITEKNIATIAVFFITLPFTSLLFGFFIISIPLTVIIVGLAEASQGYGGPPWPLGLHIGLSIFVGGILSLILSLLIRAYVGFRNRVVANEGQQ